MARKYSKIVSVVLLVVISFQIVACNVRSVDDILGSAASSYAYGKETEAFEIPDSEKTLDDMIQKFSGSYTLPDDKQLSDDEYIDLMRKLFDPDFDLDDEEETTSSTETTDTTDSTDTSGTTSESTVDVTPIGNTVSNLDDFARILHKALYDVSPMVEFTYASGCFFDISDCINDVYYLVERQDPLLSCCVSSWAHRYIGNKCTLFIYYVDDAANLKKLRSETESLVQTVKTKLQPEGKSDYQIVYDLNEYICDTVYYPEHEPYADNTYTAYGALHDGCAVCMGYACATKLILNACGIEADIEFGVCNGGGLHAWNLVKLDGDWYQLDVCWDDGSGSRLEYFLVDDDYMHRSRTWDSDLYPVCEDEYAA